LIRCKSGKFLQSDAVNRIFPYFSGPASSLFVAPVICVCVCVIFCRSRAGKNIFPTHNAIPLQFSTGRMSVYLCATFCRFPLCRQANATEVVMLHLLQLLLMPLPLLFRGAEASGIGIRARHRLKEKTSVQRPHTWLVRSATSRLSIVSST